MSRNRTSKRRRHMSGEVRGPFWSLCFKQEAEKVGAGGGG